MILSNRFGEALQLALRLHGDQLRKGTDVPYFTHLMAVSALVGEYGGDEDLMIAALLHDALEDRPDQVTQEQITAQFGWRVTQTVLGCSDCTSKPKPAWEPRKRAYLERLRTTSADIKLVAAADKLHNGRALVRDAHVQGEAMWARFNAGKDQQCWYLRECLNALRDGWSNPILHELEETHRALEAVCGA